VLEARLEAGPMHDPWVALEELRAQVREALDQLVADVIEQSGDVDASEVQQAWDLDHDLDRTTERGMLTAALFSLAHDDRGLFAEAVVDGFPVDAVAAARGRDEAEVVRELQRVVDQLARRLGRSVEDTLEAYRFLGEVLQAERIDPQMPVSG
jgi:DNA-directed RNA polymerase specialized sigma24 family protein